MTVSPTANRGQALESRTSMPLSTVTALVGCWPRPLPSQLAVLYPSQFGCY